MNIPGIIYHKKGFLNGKRTFLFCCRIIVLLLAPAILGSCRRQEKGRPAFFPLRQQTYDQVGQRTEYIVLAYPPSDQEQLTTLIKSYNDTTIDMAAAEHKYKYYTRYFLRESDKTKRDFIQDNSYLNEDHIGNHTEDIIAYLKWETCAQDPAKIKWVLTTKDMDGKEKNLVIKDNCK